MKLSTVLALAVLASIAVAQQPAQQPNTQPITQPAKRTLKIEDYSQWEMLGPSAISPDGRWFAAMVNKVDDDGYLILRNCDTPDKKQIPFGSFPRMSDDSKWCAYTIGVAKKEADKLREQKKPVENSLGLTNLANGQEIRMESVQSWTLTKGGGFLVAHKYRTASRQTGGSDLIVTNLTDLTTVTIGNVATFTVQKEGRLVALGIDSGGDEKGVQVYIPATSTVRNIHAGKGAYSGLRWAEETETLGLLFGTKDEKKEGDWNVIVRATRVDQPSPTLQIYDPKADEKFPKGFRISEFGGLELTEDGGTCAFGIRAWEDKKAASVKPEDKPNVDVWHWKDVEPQPLQQRQVEQKKRETYLCLWDPAKSAFTQIGSEQVRQVSLLKGAKIAVWEDPKPYASGVWVGGLDYSDWYVIDSATGRKTKVLEKRQFGASPSPDGKYLMYWSQKSWWLYDIAKDTRRNVTKDLKQRFEDVDYDGPQKETPPEAGPQWLYGDAAVVLYDKFDAFLVRPEAGVASRLTEGARDRQIYRLVDAGFREDGIRISDPWYFRVVDEDTRASGYFRRETDGKGKMLTIADANVTGLRRAKNVDRMLFVMGSFEKSPNVYLTNEVFAQAKPMTGTNAQQAGFLWGRAELVNYKSKWGVPLKGILMYPADYEKGRTYPMITYIYERLSQNLHNYSVPNPFSPYNPQAWSQNGYFVFMPDICYRTNQPGESAVGCLEPAVAAALAKKVGIDPSKIGLVGHSWGGYQTAYVPTQTKVFAAAVAGAPLTELTSMYNSFYWNVGITNQVIFESSQGRFDRPWWEDPEITQHFIKNSPVWNAKNLAAPMMIAFGDLDGAVDWHQGQYYYNTLRRMGKTVVMLLYPGENHGLAKKPNQKDYAHRVQHWFDVFLKNVPPEPWVKEGVPAVKKGEDK